MVVLQNRLDGVDGERRQRFGNIHWTTVRQFGPIEFKRVDYLNGNSLFSWVGWMLEWTNRYEKELPRGETTALTIIHVHSNKYPILGQDRATRWTGIKTAILGGWQMRLVLRHSLFESTKRSTGGCGMAIDWEIYIEWYGSGRKDNKRARGGGWRKRN